jgi:hypothetical protein
MGGNQLSIKKERFAKGPNTTYGDLTAYPSGNYLLNIRSKNFAKTFKVIKK